MVFLTGHSWRVLKSGYTVVDIEQGFRCSFADAVNQSLVSYSLNLSTAGISLRRTNSAGPDVVLLRVSWLCSFFKLQKKSSRKIHLEGKWNSTNWVVPLESFQNFLDLHNSSDDTQPQPIIVNYVIYFPWVTDLILRVNHQRPPSSSCYQDSVLNGHLQSAKCKAVSKTHPSALLCKISCCSFPRSLYNTSSRE